MRGVLAVLLVGMLLGPWAMAKQKERPELKLTASLDTSSPEHTPLLVVEILNQSGHTLHIPDPPLLCAPAPGALSLDVKFTAEDHEPQQPANCSLEVDGNGLPDIRERSKSWLVLKQGQTYEARRPLNMGLDASARGTYDLRVIYSGPCANDAEFQELQQAGIAVPSGRFQSEKLTYKVTLLK